MAASVVLVAGLATFVACGPRSDRGGPGFTVALVDLQGRSRVLGTLPGSVFAPRVSPDGTHVAFELREDDDAGGAGTERVWVAPIDRLDRRRMLPPVGTGRNWAPMWTRDGEHLVFLVNEGGENVLYRRRVDGTGDPQRLVAGLSAESTTPDGRRISFITLLGDRDYGISMLHLGALTTQVLVDRPGSEQHSSHISPDGRWFAYVSNELDGHQIWMEPLPPDGERHRVTRDGGSHPVWSADGTALFYDRDSTLFRVSFSVQADDDVPGGSAPEVGDHGQDHGQDHGDAQATPVFGEPEALPISGFQQGYRRRQFDLMPDGEHVLLLYPPGVLRR